MDHAADRPTGTPAPGTPLAYVVNLLGLVVRDQILCVIATVVDTQPLRWWLLGFGLRKDVAGEVRAAAGLYEGVGYPAEPRSPA